MTRVQIRRTIYHARPGFLIPVPRRTLKLALKADISVDERFALTGLILCSPRIAQ